MLETNMRKIAFCAAIFLAGCSTSSGLQPTVQRSGFDGATVVNIEPHGTSCSSFCTTIGAQWSSKAPDSVILSIGVVGYTNYHVVSGAAVRINDKIIELTPAPVLTSHANTTGARQSEKDFYAPLSLVEEIVASDDAWIRVRTNSGVMDDLIVSGGKDSKAYHALGRLLSSIKEQQ
jgi:hypothetical protein